MCVYTCIPIPSLSMMDPSSGVLVRSSHSFIYSKKEDLMKILMEDRNAISLL